MLRSRNVLCDEVGRLQHATIVKLMVTGPYATEFRETKEQPADGLFIATHLYLPRDLLPSHFFFF